MKLGMRDYLIPATRREPPRTWNDEDIHMDITPLDIIPADGAEQDNVKEPKDEGSINDSVDNEVGVTAEAEVNREENKQQWQSTQGESMAA